MTRHDLFDQPVSLTDAAAVREWNAMISAFLAHGAMTPVHLGKLLEIAPDFAAAHALKGLFYALLGRREVMHEAQIALACAEALESGANARERSLIVALRHFLEGDPSVAITAIEATLASAPTDR